MHQRYLNSILERSSKMSNMNSSQETYLIMTTLLLATTKWSSETRSLESTHLRTRVCWLPPKVSSINPLALISPVFSIDRGSIRRGRIAWLVNRKPQSGSTGLPRILILASMPSLASHQIMSAALVRKVDLSRPSSSRTRKGRRKRCRRIITIIMALWLQTLPPSEIHKKSSKCKQIRTHKSYCRIWCCKVKVTALRSSF